MNLFFNKKRPDGKIVEGGDPMIHIMPYISRGRNDSAIYYRDTIRIDGIQEYIREQRREGRRVTLFNIIITAMLHLIYQRPRLNRFIAGRRLYDHNDFDIQYVVKTDMHDDAFESVARVGFDEDDSLFSICEAMKASVDDIRDSSDKWDDKFIKFCVGMPRWVLRLFAVLLRWADFHGYLPKSWIKQIPMYSSVFISHLGSIGGDSPFHHLYEFGTTSIFMTIGKVYQKPYPDKDGGTQWCKVIDLCFTIDERICDGYYLIKSLKLFNHLLSDPALLEYSPADLDKLSDEELKALKRKLKNNGQEESDEEPELQDRPY